jgi:protein-tyrosine phosphatase
MLRVLFVCTGNICRSPTADAIMRHYVEAQNLYSQFTIDSAGLTGFHAGESPDRRSAAAAQKRGVDMSMIVARQFVEKDYYDFDLILAMDSGHLEELNRRKLDDAQSEVALFLEYTGNHEVREVADPYYGGAQGFKDVLDLIEDGCKAIIDRHAA